MPDEPREPLTRLRVWESESDPGARARARTRLDAHIAAARQPKLRSQPRARLVLALTLLVLAVGAGVAAASGFWRTQHTGHLPVFTSSGTLSPRFRVASTGVGYCWTDSLSTRAADAYRCMQGNVIHDPCFAATPHADTVACFIDPWHPVTLLHLSKKLPRHSRVTGPTLPWAIETTDGRRCTFLTGATAAMGGERINYGCTDGSFLLGAPDEHRPVWTIRSAVKYQTDKPGHPRPIASFPLAKIARTTP